MSVGTVLMMASGGIIAPVLPLYVRGFDVGVTLIGVVVGAAGLSRIVLNFPAGYVSDSLGRRPLLVAGPLLTALAAVLAGLAGNVWQLLAFRFLGGAGTGLFMTGSIILLSDIQDSSDRMRAISLYRAAIMVGVTLGPVIGGLVAELAGFRAPFFVVAGLATMAALWSYGRVPETRQEAEGRIVQDGTAAEQSLRARLGLVMGDANLLLVSLVTFNMFFILIGARQSIIPLIANERIGIGAGALGGIFALISVSNLLSIWPAGYFADRFGRKRVIVPSGLISAGSLLLFAFSRELSTFVVAAVIMGVGTGLASPSTATYAADIAPARARGAAMGLYQTLGDSGFVVGPMLLGWLAEVSDFGWALAFNAALAIVASLLFGAFARDSLASKGPHPARESPQGP
ncbi:MAG: MFS transporter [Dehalococcoidia bacterium]